MSFLHFDEAKRAAVLTLKQWLPSAPDTRALLIADLYGKLRLLLWVNGEINTEVLGHSLIESSSPWWTGEILRVEGLDEINRRIYNSAWDMARPDEDELQLRVLSRHRSRTAWFSGPVEPPWETADQAPPILVFYSFKGGVGRTTLLASFAIQRARDGERVCVLDFDLDSPGIGRLLSADPEGSTSPWGIVDFLLEHAVCTLPISDYFHRCDRVAGTGQLLVFPAGNLDSSYADKLARIDLEEAPNAQTSGLVQLLKRIKEELNPKWILMDARTGISEAAGQLLSGIAHFHVLLGTNNPQSWQGLDQVLNRLGKERFLVADRPQGEVMLVQAMVPAGPAGELSRREFDALAEDAFDDLYYLADDAIPDGDDRFWALGDKGTETPHAPIAIEYDAKFASGGDISAIADQLCSAPYTTITERILNSFLTEHDE